MTQVEFIQKSVAESNYVTVSQLTGKKRPNEYVEARAMFSRILRNMGFTLKRIGIFINRDHTTVMHLLDIHDKMMFTNRHYKEVFEDLSELIQSHKPLTITYSTYKHIA